jgi:hypothetical protein
MTILLTGVGARGGESPQALLTDTFTDANDTGLDAHVMDVGSGWTEHAGVWEIQGNQGRDASGIGNTFATADAGVSDVTAEVTFATVSTGATSQRLAFRFTDVDNLWITGRQPSNDAQVFLFDRVAGTFTQRGVASHAWGNGDVVRAVLSGNDIDIVINDVAKITHSSSNHNTATRYGLGCSDVAARYDDFEVTG